MSPSPRILTHTHVPSRRKDELPHKRIVPDELWQTLQRTEIGAKSNIHLTQHDTTHSHRTGVKTDTLPINIFFCYYFCTLHWLFFGQRRPFSDRRNEAGRGRDKTKYERIRWARGMAIIYTPRCSPSHRVETDLVPLNVSNFCFSITCCSLRSQAE